MNCCGIEFDYELTKDEQKFIKHLVDNDFKILKYKQHISKLKLTLMKDSITFPYELSKDVTNMKLFLNKFDESWELTKRIKELEAMNKD